MRNRTRCFNPASPIVRLWALRILVRLNGHRNFISWRGFSDDNLADSLGLGKWNDDALDHSSSKAVSAELRKLHEQAEKYARTAQPSPELMQNIARLGDLAGLTDTARRILEFAVLMHDDPILAAAARNLEGLNSRSACNVLAVVLDLPESNIRPSLHRDSMLLKSGLLALDHNSTDLFGKLDLISSDFPGLAMLPDMSPNQLLQGVAIPCKPPGLRLDDFPHLKSSLDILIPYLRHAVTTDQPGVNVLLHGSPGTGKTQLARVLAKHMGCELFEVAGEDNTGDPISGIKRLRALRSAQCFLGKGGSLILFDEVEDVFDDGMSIFRVKSAAQDHKAWINRMLEGNPAPTFWLSNSIRGIEPAFMRRFDMVIEVGVPPRGQRERTARAVCGELVDETTLMRISDCETLAPAVVTRAAAVVRTIGKDMDRQQAGKATEHLIDSILVAQGHAPLRANDANRLTDLYDPAFIHADVDLTRIPEGLAQSRSGRLCLYGPPGTGKTAYARWLAQQLSMPLMVKRASDLLSMWVGKAEKNIAAAFRSAERDGAILLIDEVDSFLQDRQGAQRSWEVTQVNEMLTQMEAFPGIFIASTNLMDGLDQAALRRFDLKVRFDYLKPAQVVAILHRHCERLGLPLPDGADALVGQRLRNLTPGDFAAVMRRHRFHPFASTAELISALRAECAIKVESRAPIGFLH